MLQWLMYIIFGLVILNFIIFVHECGHYLVSKLLGVDVQKISIGFGIPAKFYTTKHNLIDVKVCWIPLGGYCKLKGSGDLKKALSKNKNQFIDTTIGSIYSVHPVSRFFIYLAGPAFNFILSFLLITIFYLMPYMADNTPAKVINYTTNELVDDKLVDDTQKFKSMDLIIEINGHKIDTFDDAYEILKKAGEKKEKISAKVLRDGDIKEIFVTPREDTEGNFIFSIAKYEELKIRRIEHKSIEYKSGLREKDVIINANGKHVYNSIDFLNFTENEEHIKLVVLREGIELNVDYTPVKENGKTIYSFAFDKPIIKKNGKSLGKSMAASWKDIKHQAVEIISSLASALRGERKLSQTISGPRKAVKSSGELAVIGLSTGIGTAIRTIIYISAILSLSLSMLNLIPFPGLDGSGAILAIVEFFRKDKILPPRFYGIFELIMSISGALLMGIITLFDFFIS